MIPGRYGRVEWFDGHELAAYSDRPKVFAKVWAIPSVQRHQTGDQEMRAVFPVEALEQVAGVIRAKRRRSLSSEAARALGARTAYRATCRPQDRSKGHRQGVWSAASWERP